MAARYTEEELNKADRQFLVRLVLSQQEQLIALNEKLDSLDRNMQLMMEQLVLNKKARFGRSSEKLEDPQQLSFMEVDGNLVFFNEAEAVNDPSAPEPEEIEAKPARTPKRKGKKSEDIKDLHVNPIGCYLSEEELIAEFGEKGWKQLPDAIEKRYRFQPARVEVDEYHIGVYSDKKDGHMIKADHPKALLHGSLVSPSIGAAIMNAKYVNAVPLYRLEQEFARYGLSISRQNMANWMIRLGEEYISVMYDYLHELLYGYHVIQADETTVEVNKDGRPAGAKSYMWVYRTGHMYKEKQIVLYEYQKTRNSSHPRAFLKDFSGVCVTDGYQVYHTVEKEKEDLKVAGCWIHMRRKLNDALEVIKDKEAQKRSLAYPAMKQIQAIYREEGKLRDLPSDERLLQRRAVIAPLADALFKYFREHAAEVPSAGALHEAFTYALNQERYLRVFLEDGDVPMDNNASERAIRGFTVGRKNWVLIDTVNGAKTSAMIYSIAETAKANALKPYEYFEYLLEEIPKHLEDTDRSFLDDLLPWSEKLPDRIRKSNK